MTAVCLQVQRHPGFCCWCLESSDVSVYYATLDNGRETVRHELCLRHGIDATAGRLPGQHSDCIVTGVWRIRQPARPVVGDSNEAVRRLDAIAGGDPEVAHGEADRVLLEFAPPTVREAYARVQARCPWWAGA